MISWPAACGMRWVKPSRATVSPSETSPAIPSSSVTMSATPRTSEGEGPGAALDGHPLHLRELVHRERAAEPAPAAVLDTAERHLRLVVDGLVVDVDDPGLEPAGDREPAVGVGRDHAGREPVAGGVRGGDRLVGAVDHLDRCH